MPAPTPFDVIYSPFSAGVLPAFVVDPDEGELISVSFNPTYLPYVVGAAKSLVQPALYRGVADIELQLNRANLLLSMINNPNVYERPFYDDDEQMDDSTLPVAPWYEEVSDWIITLFLAVTFTPGAAIVYKTTIPRLRLAFRTGNIGTIVRVLIDDIEVWTGNTYSASEGMLETVIDVPATPGIMRSLLPNEHILKVVHAGETGQKLEVVRGDIRPQMTTLLRMDQQCGTLQVSYDGGAHWENVVDIGSCITAGVNTGIQDALDDGTLAAPAQQPAGGTVPSMDCKTYKITLRGNSRWNCPNPVAAGYTVTVSNARGATGDNGTITAVWGCADGKNYFLGACGAYNATQPTDPLQSAAHLRLIGYCNGVYTDMYNTSYTIPQGTPASAFFLQVNDGNISDNQGELQLDVTVCNYSSWRKYWNALDSDLVALDYGTKVGSDIVGTNTGSFMELQAEINQSALAGTTITKVRAEYSTSGAWDSYVFDLPPFTWFWTGNQTNGAHLWIEYTGSYALPAAHTLMLRMSAHAGGSITLHRLEVYGSGNVLPGGHEF